MNSEIPEVVCNASYELVIKRSSAVGYELESYVRNQTVAAPLYTIHPPILYLLFLQSEA